MSPRHDLTRQQVSAAALAAATAAAAKTRRDLPDLLDLLAALVRLDTGEDAGEGQEAAAALLAERLSQVGCRVELECGAGRATVLASLAGNGTARVALVGHYDTIYPAGTAARGLEVRGERAYGPGAADMKGGLVLGVSALGALAALDLRQRPFAFVEFHIVPDEESRPRGAFTTIDRVLGVDACFVLECARQNGDLVIERKAQGSLTLHARGRSAHAGTHPERGRSALLAMCREALRCDALNESREGLTVTVSMLNSGTGFGVVPDRAVAALDCRAWATVDVEWALEQVCDTGAHDGVTLTVKDVTLWPAMAATAASRRHLAIAKEIGRHLGTPVGARRSGGVSDGCWTSSAGVTTLDGLGPIGGHDHSPDEYIDLASLPERCGLLAGLVMAVEGMSEAGGDE